MPHHKCHRKSKCEPKVSECAKPVFTFCQMEEIINLIDRQARIISEYRRPPHRREVMFADNPASVTTTFTLGTDGKYTMSLNATNVAITLYTTRGITTYTDGIIRLVNSTTSGVLPIAMLNNNIVATYVNGTTPQLVFSGIPVSIITNAATNGYLTETTPGVYTAVGDVNYVRYI